jgi:hypothetical protein
MANDKTPPKHPLRHERVNQQLSALLARRELCKTTKKVVPEAVKLSVILRAI